MKLTIVAFILALCGTTRASETPTLALPLPQGVQVRVETPYRAKHFGLDLAAPSGTPVLASAAGTVIRASYNETDPKISYGNVVIVDHGKIGENYYYTLYAHLASYAPDLLNKTVAAGALLGTVGSTGLSTGPHVHYEVLASHGQPITNLRTTGIMGIWNYEYRIPISVSSGAIRLFDAGDGSARSVSSSPAPWVTGTENPSYPHVIATATPGAWAPAAGDAFVNDNPDDLVVVWQVGQAHPTLSHVVASANSDRWAPSAGYAFANTNPDDLTVVWQAGQPHPTLSHVIASANADRWAPEAGYAFVNDTPGDLEVMWVSGMPHPTIPHVAAASDEGWWTPEPGYAFLRPGTGDLATAWNPGLVHPTIPHYAAGANEGEWLIEDGYGMSVIDEVPVWQPGIMHPRYPHVMTGQSAGVWIRDPGYVWANSIPGDFSVVWQSGTPHPDCFHVVAADAEGSWTTEPGYVFTGVTSFGWTGVAWQPGIEHPSYRHVLAGAVAGNWVTESGFSFLNSNNGDFRVRTSGSNVASNGGSDHVKEHDPHNEHYHETGGGKSKNTGGGEGHGIILEAYPINLKGG